MLMSRRGSGRAVPALKVECLIGALVAASIGLPAAQAASFGHSRIVSGMGQPLHVEIPVTELSEPELQTLRARPAPAQAWRDAGMTPPVALESMRLVLLDGYRPDVKVIQLRSEQSFDQPIVDVLIDIQSASGQQRYQVSLVAAADTATVSLPSEDVARNARGLDRGASAQPGAGQHVAGKQIRVRPGDTMFSIARRNAVEGVTIYQLMMGLQRANPQAFIQDNVNLVKADAVLTMPDVATLTQLSDREARRLFLQHVQAFNKLRRRGVQAAAVVVPASGEAVSQGPLSTHESVAGPAASQPSVAEDRLRLSPPPSQAGNAGGSSLTSGATTEGTNAANGGPPADASNLPSATVSPQSGNLLASSSVIATDAPSPGRASVISPDVRGAGGFGAGVASSGTAVQADGTHALSPDDQAALSKGMAETQNRIVELEDNVRHLNEALQKQGHVAAETAMEGVREVGEVIKEIIKLVEPEDATQPAIGDSNTSTEMAAGGMASSGGDTVAGNTPTGEGASQGDSAVRANASDASTAAQGAPGSVSSTVGAAGSTSSSNASSAGSGHASRSGPTELPRSGPRDQWSADGSQDGPGSPEGSWFKDNLLALIGGGLAFIVLLIVWLLRRAARSKPDVFESDSPITDTMVREKLREIDLDLDHSPERVRR